MKADFYQGTDEEIYLICDMFCVLCVSVMLHTKSAAWLRAGYPNVISEEKEKEKDTLTHPPYIYTDLLFPVLSRE